MTSSTCDTPGTQPDQRSGGSGGQSRGREAGGGGGLLLAQNRKLIRQISRMVRFSNIF